MAEEKQKENLVAAEEAQDARKEVAAAPETPATPTKTAKPHRESRDSRKERRDAEARENALANWRTKTRLGKMVLEGKITLDQIFERGYIIKEPEIIDFFVPNLESEVVFIGGSTGKGGGIRRTPTKRTARMHRSGRRFKNSAMVIVGNLNGYVGIGYGVARESRRAIEKAFQNAKINIIPVRRGCGSWECGCRTPHSIPFKTEGKCGTSRIELLPAPKGLGLAASDPVKGVLRLAGIKDVWVRSDGNTGSRQNFIMAVFGALRGLNTLKITNKEQEKTGLHLGSTLHRVATEG
jgi:small subunit ribosomal protein S5